MFQLVAYYKAEMSSIIMAKKIFITAQVDSVEDIVGDYFSRCGRWSGRLLRLQL